jgi:hypothetical protein
VTANMGATFRSHLEVFQWQTGLPYSAHEGHIPQLTLSDVLEFILHFFCRGITNSGPPGSPTKASGGDERIVRVPMQKKILTSLC